MRKIVTWVEANEMLERLRLGFFIGPPQLWIHKSFFSEAVEQPDEPPKPFPNWQPVKCSDEFCGWRGPAAKSVSWGEDDPKRYCPKCWNKVVKHESNGGSLP